MSTDSSPPITDAVPKSGRNAQKAFFARMAPGAFTALFAGLEGVTFFIKDIQGRFMGFSPSTRQGLDFGMEQDILGLTDYDLYPVSVADRIRADDLKVMESQQPLLNIVELLVNPARSAIGWYVTNKFPVPDADGQVIGIMGTVQPYEGRRRRLLAGTRLDEVVEKIRQDPAARHSVDDLARLACMSARQLGRHFQAVLGMSPRNFMMLCRMQKACEQLVQPSRSIAEIAQETGFYDQSAFAVQFRRAIGMAPLDYRRRYLNAASAQTGGGRAMSESYPNLSDQPKSR